MPPRFREPRPPRNPNMFPPMRRPSPPMNRMNRSAPKQFGGGLLAKLLGKGGEQRGSGNPFSLPTASTRNSGGGGGFMKTLTDPKALDGILTNTQKVLNSAQQIGPMVEQYGPLVKNLPSLWKLYKGFKDLPSEEVEGTEEKRKVRENIDMENHDDVDEESSSSSSERERKKREVGQSYPKLYI